MAVPHEAVVTAQSAKRMFPRGAWERGDFIPFSWGGTSLKAENIQLLRARHNIAKSASSEYQRHRGAASASR